MLYKLELLNLCSTHLNINFAIYVQMSLTLKYFCKNILELNIFTKIFNSNIFL